MSRYWAQQLFDAGQSSHFQFQRRLERRRERHKTKSFYKALQNISSQEDDDGCSPLLDFIPPNRSYRDILENRDHLAPLYRFLESRCGQEWNAVYSEICRRADHRSLYGDHLLGHVKDYVRFHEFDERFHSFYLNSSGLLQKTVYPGWIDPQDRKDLRDHPKALKLLASGPKIEASASWLGRSFLCDQPKIVLCGEIPFWGKGVSINNSTGDWRYKPHLRLNEKHAEIYWSLREKNREAITYRPK